MFGHKKRRTYLVNAAQRRLVGFNLFYYASFILVFSAAIWVPPALGLLGDDLTERERVAAAHALLFVHERLIPVAVFMAIAFTVHGIFVSHRLAGPLVRFRRHYGEVGRGDLRGRIRLRRRDYIHEDADAFNEMLDGLNALLQDVGSGLEEVRGACRDLGRAIDAGDPEDVEHASRLLADKLEGCETAWERIELGRPRVELDLRSLESVPAPLAESTAAEKSASP